MTNILTIAEAASVLRCESNDPVMLGLLPGIDAYVHTATGHDWTADSPINEAAKNAARILLVLWYDSPAMVTNGMTSLHQGMTAVLTQLETIALRYKIFAGLAGAGSIDLPGARAGDTVSTLIGVVGVTGDHAAKFETVITQDDQIQQTSTDDLSDNYYRALLTPPE